MIKSLGWESVGFLQGPNVHAKLLADGIRTGLTSSGIKISYALVKGETLEELKTKLEEMKKKARSIRTQNLNFLRESKCFSYHSGLWHTNIRQHQCHSCSRKGPNDISKVCFCHMWNQLQATATTGEQEPERWQRAGKISLQSSFSRRLIPFVE